MVTTGNNVILLFGLQCCERCGIEETPAHLSYQVDDFIEVKLSDFGTYLCGECDAETWSRIERYAEGMER